jgi:hypothetical protein
VARQQFYRPNRRSDDHHGVYDDPGYSPHTGPDSRSILSKSDQTLGDIDDVLAENEKLMGAAKSNSEDLASAEESAALPKASPADKAESNLAGTNKPESKKDDNASLFKGGDEEDAPGWRAKLLNRKNALRGAAISIVLGGSIGAFSVVQGPLQGIHFAKVLDGIHMTPNNDFSNNRATRLLRYMRYRDQPEMRRLGVFMNRYANRVEARWKKAGFTPIYDGAGGRLSGFKVDPNTNISAFEADGIKPTTNPDGSRTISFDDMFTSGRRGRRSFNAVSKGANYNKAIASINTRVLGKRAGVSFKIYANERRRANESLEKFYARVRERLAGYYKNGSSALRIRSQGEDGPDEGTEPDGDADADNANQAADNATDEVKNGGQDGISKGRNRLKNDLDKGGGMFDLVCLAKGIAANYPKAQYANIILPLLRIGAGTMTQGSEVMLGKGVNMQEIGAVSSTFYDESNDNDPNTKPSSWASARSIQAELGKPQTGPDIPPSARPSNLGNNRALNTFDKVTNKITGFGTACKINNSAVGGFAISFLGGGVAGIATDLLFQYGLQAAGIDIFGFLVRLVAGEEVDGFATGATLGNFANYGARLAANDSAIAMGGRRLNDNEELVLAQESEILQQEEMRYASLGTKLFDIEDPRSVSGKLFFDSSVPQSPGEAVSGLASAPGKLLATIAKPLSMSSTAYAQESSNNNGYDYGFEAFGFSQAEQDDPRNDPYLIAEELQKIFKDRTAAEESCKRRGGGDCEWTPSNMQEVNQKYSRCFGAEILQNYGPDQVEAFASLDTVNYLSKEEEGGRPNHCETGYIDNEGSLRHGPETAANDMRVIRFYLADTVIGHSMACYEGEESSCKLFGFGGGLPTGSSSGSTTNNIIAGDTSNLTCEAGTDGGVVDGYQNGQLYKIRVCVVQGITVNAQVAKQVDSMITDAKAVGVRITGSGFRTMESQRRLYAEYQNGGNKAARPGYSNHQMGLAIDINYSELNAALTTCQANPDRYPTYKWLAGNAAKYGFFAKVKSECWHWSVTGG